MFCKHQGTTDGATDLTRQEVHMVRIHDLGPVCRMESIMSSWSQAWRLTILPRLVGPVLAHLQVPLDVDHVPLLITFPFGI